jgi:hypothetical protein
MHGSIPVIGNGKIDKLCPSLVRQDITLLLVQFQRLLVTSGVKVDGEGIAAIFFEDYETATFVAQRMHQEFAKAALTKGQLSRTEIAIDFHSHGGLLNNDVLVDCIPTVLRMSN